MKKLLLTLGTVGGVIAPIAAVVSCGEDTNKNKVIIDDVKNLKLKPLFNGSKSAKDFFDLKAKILSPDYHGNLESDFRELKNKKGNIEAVWNNYLNDIKEKINESNVDQSFKDDLIKRLFDEVNDGKIGDNILKELNNKIYDGKWGFVKHTDGFVFSEDRPTWSNKGKRQFYSSNDMLLKRSDFSLKAIINWISNAYLEWDKKWISSTEILYKLVERYNQQLLSNNREIIFNYSGGKAIYKITPINLSNNIFNFELKRYNFQAKWDIKEYDLIFKNQKIEESFKNSNNFKNNFIKSISNFSVKSKFSDKFIKENNLLKDSFQEKSLIKITPKNPAYTYYSHYHGFYEFATFDKKDTLGEPVNIYLDKTINDYYNWIIENDTNNGLKIKIKDTFKNKDLSELSVDDLLIAENKNINKDVSGKETFNSTLTYDSTNKWFNYHSVGKIKFLGATKNGTKTDLKFQLLVRTGKEDIDKTITVKPKEFTITI